MILLTKVVLLDFKPLLYNPFLWRALNACFPSGRALNACAYSLSQLAKRELHFSICTVESQPLLPLHNHLAVPVYYLEGNVALVKV